MVLRPLGPCLLVDFYTIAHFVGIMDIMWISAFGVQNICVELMLLSLLVGIVFLMTCTLKSLARGLALLMASLTPFLVVLDSIVDMVSVTLVLSHELPRGRISAVFQEVDLVLFIEVHTHGEVV